MDSAHSTSLARPAAAPAPRISLTRADDGFRRAPNGLEDLQDRQGSFAGILARSELRAQSPEQRARAAAEQLVSIGLVQPLLAQLRAGNHAAPPFAPSQAERQFQSLMDAEISQRITRASGLPLVERLTQAMMKRARPAQEIA